MLDLHNANLYHDSLLMLRARHDKHWWGIFLMTDLSLQIVHECENDWWVVNPLGQCGKCRHKFGFEENQKGGYKLEYISDVSFNHDNMYNLQDSADAGHNVSKVLRLEDPLVVQSSSTMIDEIMYRYIRYKAGFSLILHGKKGMAEMHVSALFLNEGEENLVETKEGKCKLCKEECRGAAMRGFLILKAQLGEN